MVPNDGRWFIVINLGGYSGQVRSSVRVLPGAMPPAKNIMFLNYLHYFWEIN